MTGKLSGKSALVTGGSHGIGRGIALAFAHAGADVYFCCLEDDEAARGVVKEAEECGVRAGFTLCDISQPGKERALFDAAVTAHGGLDILVNNVAYIPPKKFLEMSFEDYDKSHQVILRVPYVLSRLFADALIARGAKGSIISISSIAATRTRAERPAYAAHKAGLSMLMKSLAWELGPHGIRANAISPGMVVTKATAPFFDQPDNERWERMRALIPLGRAGQGADFGKLAAFLASDEAEWLTGVDVALDGGMSLF